MLGVVDASTTAIVPFKALRRAKGRLGDALDATERKAVSLAMLDRVLSACRAAAHVVDLVVVCGDREGSAAAAARGARVLLEPSPGLPAALAAADAATRDAPATVIVAADLPLATGEDLDAVCEAGSAGPCVVVAGTRDGGTAALLRRPPGVVGTAYGPGSAAAHLALAADAGVRAVRLDLPRLALDVDTPAALREASARMNE